MKGQPVLCAFCELSARRLCVLFQREGFNYELNFLLGSFALNFVTYLKTLEHPLSLSTLSIQISLNGGDRFGQTSICQGSTYFERHRKEKHLTAF